MSKPGEKQIALIPDKIYLGNPLDKNSGFDWPGVMRLSLEIKSALSASFGFGFGKKTFPEE